MPSWGCTCGLPVGPGPTGQDRRPAWPPAALDRGPSRPAIGATATVHLPDGRRLVAQVDGGNGHSGKRSPDLHFGLGQLDAQPKLRVDLRWRGADGRVREQTVLAESGAGTRCCSAKSPGDEGRSRESEPMTRRGEPLRRERSRTRRATWRHCAASPSAITVLTVLGHAFLGFEQSYAQPLVALATAYGMQLLLEVGRRLVPSGRRPRFAGGLVALVNFLLSAHITGLAIAMLLYFNDRLWVVAFAAAVAIGSKTLFRAPVGAGSAPLLQPVELRHQRDPAAVPVGRAGDALAVHGGLAGIGDWVCSRVIFVLGSFINVRYTRRIAVDRRLPGRLRPAGGRAEPVFRHARCWRASRR